MLQRHVSRAPAHGDLEGDAPPVPVPDHAACRLRQEHPDGHRPAARRRPPARPCRAPPPVSSSGTKSSSSRPRSVARHAAPWPRTTSRRARSSCRELPRPKSVSPSIRGTRTVLPPRPARRRSGRGNRATGPASPKPRANRGARRLGRRRDVDAARDGKPSCVERRLEERDAWRVAGGRRILGRDGDERGRGRDGGHARLPGRAISSETVVCGRRTRYLL
mgnify:CR=1 FL=1